MPRPDISTPARRTAVGIEDRIRRDALETGALVAPAGSLIVERPGRAADRVSLTVAELRQATGATFTHNHPGGTGPSVDDVVVCAEFGLGELRVVTSSFRHGVSFPTPVALDSIRSAYATEHPRVARLLTDEVRRGLVHPLDFKQELVHRTWQRVSVALRFNYWRHES